MKHETDIIVEVAGSYPLKFQFGHSCGECFGFGVCVGREFFDRAGKYTFHAGGVMDYTDILRLYAAIPKSDLKAAKRALANGKRLGTVFLEHE